MGETGGGTWLKRIAAVVVGCLLLVGCLNPRIHHCPSCKQAFGISGANLPFQAQYCTRCNRLMDVYEMTDEQWREAEKRGYVTWEDVKR